MVTISRVEYDAQQGRIAKLEQQVAILTEALRLSRHRQFGASSEKMSEDAMDQLSFLFNEAKVYLLMWRRQRKNLRLSQPTSGIKSANIRWKTFRKVLLPSRFTTVWRRILWYAPAAGRP